MGCGPLSQEEYMEDTRRRLGGAKHYCKMRLGCGPCMVVASPVPDFILGSWSVLSVYLSQGDIIGLSEATSLHSICSFSMRQQMCMSHHV